MDANVSTMTMPKTMPVQNLLRYISFYCPDIYTVPCGTTIFLLMFELTVNLIIIGIINTLTIVFNNKV